MKNIKILFLLIILLINNYSYSQCSMCKQAMESDPNVGTGINSGIIYLMLIPYIIIGFFIVFFFRKKTKTFIYDLFHKEKDVNNCTDENWY